MKKLILLVYIILSVGIVTIAQTQQVVKKKQQATHANPSKYNCYVNSSVWGEGLPLCPVCKKKDEARDAKEQAEDKKTTELARLKGIENQKKADAWGKQKVAEGKVKSREVTYAVPKTSSKVSIASAIATDKTILMGAGKKSQYNAYGPTFLNEKAEIVLKSSDWSAAYNLTEFSYISRGVFLGLVRITEPDNYNWDYDIPYKYHYAIINSKGEYLFNDKNCREIVYLDNDWFLIGKFDTPNAFLYNMITKKQIALINSNTEIDGKYGARYPISRLFLPIFSAEKVLNNEIRETDDFYRSKIQSSIKAKIFLSQTNPDIVNEDILKKNMFTLVHASYNNVDYSLSRFNTVSKLLENYGINELIVYSISKTGVVTKQTLQ